MTPSTTFGTAPPVDNADQFPAPVDQNIAERGQVPEALAGPMGTGIPPANELDALADKYGAVDAKPVDYDALAAKHGAVDAAPKPVDLDAIAAKYGAKDYHPPFPGSPPAGVPGPWAGAYQFPAPPTPDVSAAAKQIAANPPGVPAAPIAPELQPKNTTIPEPSMAEFKTNPIGAAFQSQLSSTPEAQQARQELLTRWGIPEIQRPAPGQPAAGYKYPTWEDFKYNPVGSAMLAAAANPEVRDTLADTALGYVSPEGLATVLAADGAGRLLVKAATLPAVTQWISTLPGSEKVAAGIGLAARTAIPATFATQAAEQAYQDVKQGKPIEAAINIGMGAAMAGAVGLELKDAAEVASFKSKIRSILQDRLNRDYAASQAAEQASREQPTGQEAMPQLPGEVAPPPPPENIQEGDVEPAGAPAEPQPVANAPEFIKAHTAWNAATLKAATKFMEENPGTSLDQAKAAVAGTVGLEPQIGDFKPPPPPPASPPAPEPPPEPGKPTQVDRVSPNTPNPPTAAIPTQPESPETIALQMQQLAGGQRRVVMFPQGQGMPPLQSFPPGVAIHSDGLGNVYAYRPDLIKKSEIRSAAHNNKLSDILGGPGGMGAPDKADLQGPPVAVVGRAPDGTEAQTTVTDEASLPHTVIATYAVTPEGGTIEAKRPEEALQDRQDAQPEQKEVVQQESAAPQAQPIVPAPNTPPVQQQAHLPEQAAPAVPPQGPDTAKALVGTLKGDFRDFAADHLAWMNHTRGNPPQEGRAPYAAISTPMADLIRGELTKAMGAPRAPVAKVVTNLWASSHPNLAGPDISVIELARQRHAASLETFGKKFEELTEAQKQAIDGELEHAALLKKIRSRTSTATPQVPIAPGAKYVLPTFVTGAHVEPLSSRERAAAIKETGIDASPFDTKKPSGRMALDRLIAQKRAEYNQKIVAKYSGQPVQTKLLGEIPKPLPYVYLRNLRGNPDRSFRAAKALEGSIYQNYGGGYDQILEVTNGDHGIQYKVRDLDTGEIRNHATFIDPRAVVVPATGAQNANPANQNVEPSKAAGEVAGGANVPAGNGPDARVPGVPAGTGAGAAGAIERTGGSEGAVAGGPEPENGVRRVTGSADIPLSPGGEKQVEGMADKKEVEPFSAVLYPDSERGTETARAFAGGKIPLPSLHGWSRATSEGQPADAVKVEMTHLIMNPDEVPPGVSPISGKPGQSWNQMAFPMFRDIEELRNSIKPGERFLVVTSGGNLQAIDAWGKAGYPASFQFDHSAIAAAPYWSVTGKMFEIGPKGLIEVRNNAQPGRIYLIEHGETAFNNKGEAGAVKPAAPDQRAAIIAAAKKKLAEKMAAAKSIPEQFAKAVDIGGKSNAEIDQIAPEDGDEDDEEGDNPGVLARPRTLTDDSNDADGSQIDAAYEKLLDGHGHVYVNRTAMDFIAQSLGLNGSGWGLTMDEPTSRDFLEGLRELQGNPAFENLPIAKIADAVEAAITDDPVVTVVEAGHDAPLSEIRATRREEAFHRAQMRLGLAGADGRISTALLDNPAVAGALDAMYRKKGRAYGNIQTALIELGAILGTEQGGAIGLTPEQSAAALKQYFNALIEAHGPEAGALLKYVTPRMRQALGVDYVKARWNGKPVKADAGAGISDRGNETTAPDQSARGISDAAESGKLRRPVERSTKDVTLGSGLGALQPGLEDLYKHGVIPAAKSLAEFTKKAADEIQRDLMPQTRGADARYGYNLIREMNAEIDQRRDVAHTALGGFRQWFRKNTPKTDGFYGLDAYDDAETGNTANLTGPARAFADAAHAAFQAREQELKDLDLLKTFVENYLPHIYAKPDDAAKANAAFMAKRPMAGSESFRKQRTYMTLKEGLSTGLAPKYDNPVDMVLAKLAEMDKSIMAHKAFEELDANDKLDWVPNGGEGTRPPDGMDWIKDKLFQANGPRFGVVGLPEEAENVTPADVRVFGRRIMGAWAAPKILADVVNNHLEPGTTGNLYKAYRGINNTLNLLELGLSYFHGMTTTLNASYSDIALGLQQAIEGTFKGGKKEPVGKSLTKAVTTIGRGITPFASVLTDVFGPGKKLIYAWDHWDAGMGQGKIAVQGKNGPVYVDDPISWAILDAMKAGGGSPRQDSYYATKYVERMMDGVSEVLHGTMAENAPWRVKAALVGGAAGAFMGGGVPGAAIGIGIGALTGKAGLNAPGALLEYSMRPIMDYMVPRAKVASFAKLMMEEINRNPDMSRTDLRDTAGRIWDSMDDRFGQLRQKNMMMNASAKKAINAVVGRFGWQAGSIRTLGMGATYDLTKTVGDVINNMRQAGSGETPRLSKRTYYILGLLLGHFILSAIMTYLMTRKTPEGFDYVDPETGGITETGHPARLIMPDYVSKDIQSYATNPRRTIIAKLAPELTIALQLAMNRDFYDHKIYGDGGEGLREFAKTFLYPYSAQGVLKNIERNASPAKTLLPMIGLNPAGNSVGLSKAEQMTADYMAEQNRNVRPLPTMHTRAQSQVYQAARRGDEKQAADLGTKAIMAGNMTPQQVQSSEKRARLGPLASDYKNVTDFKTAMKIYAAATDDERKVLAPEARAKVYRAQRVPYEWNDDNGRPDKELRAIVQRYFPNFRPYTPAPAPQSIGSPQAIQ